MMKNLLVALASFGILLIVPGIALAGKPSAAAPSNPLGIDVSWPQCGKQLPTNHAFGIVGVNGGLATTTNDCLKDQLIWAKKAIGGTSQERVQLYVNTANPGGLNTESWPKNNIDPAGHITSNPHDSCNNDDTLACAWQYGWNRALEDVRDRFKPAAAQANMITAPASYIWWLDVETENTWKLNGSTFSNQSNVAVLEGMAAYFESIDSRIGLYSTGEQWRQIVGNSVTSSSNLNALPSWRPGGANLSTSKSACRAAPLTTGGTIVLTQFISKGLDYNHSCV